MKLTTAEWREELRARRDRAFDIAIANDKEYGFFDERTQRAYRSLDNLNAVVRQEGA